MKPSSPLQASDKQLGRLSTNLRRQCEILQFATYDLGQAIRSISTAANTTRASTGDVEHAAESVSDQAASVAAAVEELSASIAEIANSARITSEAMHRSQSTLDELIDSSKNLSESTGEIDNVVQTVAGISGQTRLLALNATIEAARAGVAGKGFAVVATEVKDLSSQTTAATTDITQQLNGLDSSASAMQNSVSHISEALAEARETQIMITAAIEQQNSVIQDIAQSAQAAATAVKELQSAVKNSSQALSATDEATLRVDLWLGRLESVMHDQIDALTPHSGPVDHPLLDAIKAHYAWKERLATCIETGRLPQGMTLQTIGANDQCAFGQWVGGSDICASNPGRCAHVRELHTEFHLRAADIVATAVRGDRERAHTMLHDPDGFGGFAPVLTDALMDWLSEITRDTP